MDIEEQYDKLLRYCYMKLRDRTLAEDITQETFIRFMESESYRNTGKEMAYLYTIAANLCTDCFRKKKETPLEELAELPGTDDPMQGVVERLSIERAMERLDPDEREAVVLRYTAELSVGDIGKALGLSRFAVHRRISSAMKKLRKEMEDHEKI